MKTEAIKQNIVSNYAKLKEIAKETPVKPNIYPVWGLNYKQGRTKGFVNEFGTVERSGAKIDIIDGNVQTIKKPFFSTWKKTLNNINKMLEDTINNIDNKNVVTKRIVNILCFPKEFVDKLSKINKK